jgi:hypothetical protein
VAIAIAVLGRAGTNVICDESFHANPITRCDITATLQFVASNRTTWSTRITRTIVRSTQPSS